MNILPVDLDYFLDFFYFSDKINLFNRFLVTREDDIF